VVNKTVSELCLRRQYVTVDASLHLDSLTTTQTATCVKNLKFLNRCNEQITGAALLENNKASAKLTTANGGMFT